MPDDARFVFQPIGVVRSPFVEKVEAPRQPGDVRGVIEIFSTTGMRDAVADLDAFTHLWMIFVFDRDVAFRPKVTPPRSDTKRGVLGTRSPHRPNPLGLSLLQLDRIEGMMLHVTGLDVLDGTPVLDVKPYVPYADTPRSPASSGWLDPTLDPRTKPTVTFSDAARDACAFIAEATGLDLAARVTAALSLGTAPHAYRRIKRDGNELVLSVKAWRVRFREVEGGACVDSIRSGYRRAALASPSPTDDPRDVAVHTTFVDRFEVSR